MAVTGVKFIRAIASVDREMRPRVEAEYHVTTNSTSDRPMTILGGALQQGLPNQGAIWRSGNDYEPHLYCQEFSAVEPVSSDGNANTLRWMITAVFEPLADKQPGDFNPNPLNRPVKWGLQWLPRRLAMTEARKESATAPLQTIENFAGGRYDPNPEQDDPVPVVVATRNEWPLTAILGRAVTYKSATNEQAFLGQPADHVKLLPLVVPDRPSSESGIDYYPVKYRFAVNDEEWFLRLPEMGPFFLDAPKAQNGKPKQDTREDYVVPGPYKLKADGTKLDQSEDALSTRWFGRNRQDFNDLNLGSPQ